MVVVRGAGEAIGFGVGFAAITGRGLSAAVVDFFAGDFFLVAAFVFAGDAGALAVGRALVFVAEAFFVRFFRSAMARV